MFFGASKVLVHRRPLNDSIRQVPETLLRSAVEVWRREFERCNWGVTISVGKIFTIPWGYHSLFKKKHGSNNGIEVDLILI